MFHKQKARWLMGIGILLLAGVFLFPLWSITLEAPQFPGGLQLNIWINRFSGSEGGGDIIKNINILNHYIGMQAIEPDAIPELRYFPLIIYAIMGFGGISILLNKSWTYAAWAVTLIILGILGIYDFYLWMYDYGHNLDPSAPIKIEGMTYMPPLFGEKDLLNFYVTSYPGLGSLFLGLPIGMALLAFYNRTKSTKL